MHWKGITRIVRQGLVPAVAVVALASAVRLWPLQALGTGLTYITFYPAVTIAALYGGLFTGLAATLLSCASIVFAGHLIFGEPAIGGFSDWLGVAVFILTCTMISGIVEAMRRSRAKAAHVQLDLKSKNAELRATRENLEDEIKRQTAELVDTNVALEAELAKRRHAEEEGRRHLEQLRTVLEHLTEGLVVADLEGNLYHWNRAAIEMHGFERLNECRRSLHEFADMFELSTSDGRVLPVEQWPLARILRGETLRNWEVRVRRLDRDWKRVWSYGGSLARDAAGNPLLAVVGLTDITEREQAEEQRKESEARLKRSQAMAHLGSWELDLVNDVLTWSDEVYRIFGLEPQEFKASFGAFLDVVHPDDRKAVEEAYRGSLREGSDSYEIEHRIVRKPHGEVRVVHEKCDHVRDRSGRVVRSLGMVHDITERKRHEHERELTVEFLHLVNESRGIEDLIRSTAGFFQHRSGCEAVGVRIRDGNDYPYFETRGFPEEFVRSENHVCAQDENGSGCLDNEGNPVLECMCGKVISGGLDPSKPFFTAAGSFWTNSTSELLSVPLGLETDFSARNVCNRAGYESVALIPLRSGDEPWGLIQLNDSRTGCFTREIIAFWERLAQHASVALAKFTAEMALEEALDNLEARVKERTSELEAAKEAAAVERRRLYDVLETLPVYVCLLDSDYRMPFANRYFRESFGESQGRRCHEFLFNRTEPCEICETYAVMRTGAPHHWFWTGPNERDYDIYDFPFTDVDGSNLILEMGIDITERNQAARALNETLADLTRSNADLEHFAYVASHDLQEPLRNVTVALQMLEKRHKGKLDGDADLLIHYAVDGAKRMKNLVADLLKYSRVAVRNQPFEMVDVQEAVNRSILNLRSLIEQEGAIVTCDKMPTVPGDSTQLVQLFQNLVGNAVKFGRAERPKVHVSARKSDNEWIFSVKDNGIGIDERHFERIFVIFQQLNKRESFDGTGMGLAIVKKIVERHRGRVWVESETGVGSVFHVAIPDGPKV
ncbi:MAG: PAS domain S-box protein [Desulfomonilaceae bacterium]|nr:PAS domain S-box protein [Desulfomonilaceae bacterium]